MLISEATLSNWNPMKNIKLVMSPRYALASVMGTLNGLEAVADQGGEIPKDNFAELTGNRIKVWFDQLKNKDLKLFSVELFKNTEAKELFRSISANKELIEQFCQNPAKGIKEGWIVLQVIDMDKSEELKNKMFEGDYVITQTPEFILASLKAQGELKQRDVDLSTESGVIETTSLTKLYFKNYLESPEEFRSELELFANPETIKYMTEISQKSISQTIDLLTEQGALREGILQLLENKVAMFVKLSH